MKIQSVRKKLEERRFDLLNELNSLDHVIECSLYNYIDILKIVKKKGFERVVDIGCAFGYQSELFRQNGIEYIGLNDKRLNFYITTPRFYSVYYVEQYPLKDQFYIQRRSETVAISNLCIGWECYKIHDDEFDKQFKALARDFKACILYMPLEREETLKKYFKKIKKIKVDKESPIQTAYFYCEEEK